MCPPPRAPSDAVSVATSSSTHVIQQHLCYTLPSWAVNLMSMAVCVSAGTVKTALMRMALLCTKPTVKFMVLVEFQLETLDGPVDCLEYIHDKKHLHTNFQSSVIVCYTIA